MSGGGRGRAELAVLCDDQGRVTRVLRVPAYLDTDEARGRPIHDLVDAGSRTKITNMLRRTREEGAVFGWELGVVGPNGVELLQFAAGEDEGRILVVGGPAGSDVEAFYQEMMRVSNEQANELRQRIKDDARRADAPGGEADPYDEMTRLNNELAQAQREMAKKKVQLEQLNEQKNQFLGMAAHDLRNPLSIIMGYSEILREGLEDLAPAQREMLEVIESSSEFMLRMVNELLDVSRIEAGRLELDREPVDVAAFLDNNLTLNRVLADRKEIEIALDTAPDLPSAFLDMGKLDQVLNNLVSNAIKYSHEGTRVTVTAAPATLEGDAAVEIEVRDQGQGIPEDEVETLFTAFGTTSVSTTAGEESTGLGLMIVGRIVTGHGGTIEVESEVGEGTTFRVRLPLDGGDPEGAKAAEDGPPAEPPDPEGVVQAGSLEVLVVDDSRVVRRVTRGILEALGHHVREAQTGDEALEILRDGGAVDLVLLDLEMPGRTGIETVQELRRGSHGPPDIPVLLLTGSTEEEVGDRLDGVEVGGLLTKPLDRSALSEMIAGLVGSS